MRPHQLSSQIPHPAGQTVPLWQPLYGATFRQATYRFLAKYARFKGFASRSEYWWALLAQTLYGAFLGFIIGITVAFTDNPSAGILLGLAGYLPVLIPSYAITWRRFHDAGIAGPWVLAVMALSVIGVVIGLGFFPGVAAIYAIAAMPTRKDKHRHAWDDPAAQGLTAS